MLPSLAALITLQSIDAAADSSRRRIADMPSAEQALDESIAAARGHVDAAKSRLQESQTARRALEKDVAGVDTRLARFDEHKSAVKTNQEYTALLSEIATAKAEKDGIEDRILVLMEDADRLAAEVKAAEAELAKAQRDGESARGRLKTERGELEAELARLEGERAAHRRGVEPRALALYDQLLKGRRGIAVAMMSGESCAACQMRQRPHVVQMIRRNDGIVQCESCQRILYFLAPAAAEGSVASQ